MSSILQNQVFKNGDEVSPAIAIAYLIYSKKMNVNMASMLVF